MNKLPDVNLETILSRVDLAAVDADVAMLGSAEIADQTLDVGRRRQRQWRRCRRPGRGHRRRRQRWRRRRQVKRRQKVAGRELAALDQHLNRNGSINVELDAVARVTLFHF